MNVLQRRKTLVELRPVLQREISVRVKALLWFEHLRLLPHPVDDVARAVVTLDPAEGPIQSITQLLRQWADVRPAQKGLLDAIPEGAKQEVVDLYYSSR